MPTPPGYAAYSVRLKHAAVSRPAAVTGAVKLDTVQPNAVHTALATIFTGAGSDFCELMDFDVTIGPVKVWVGQDGGEDLVYESTQTRTGGVAITGLPSNCAALVHKQTARGGRRGRGRMFIPWILKETEVDEAGLILSTFVTQLQAEMTDFLADFQTQGCPMALLHQPSAPGTEHPSTPGAPNLVTSLRVDPLISTQRRRLGR